MQSLTGSPRDNLTATQVTDLLELDGTSYDAGLEQLVDGEWVDISEFLVLDGSRVTWEGRRNGAHREARLQLRRELSWPTARLRPYMVLERAGVTARWNLGVYLADAPTRTTDDDEALVQVDGWDKLSILGTSLGRTFAAESGDTYLGAAEALIREIDPDGALTPIKAQADAVGVQLPTSRVYEPSATYLDIVNDLLHAVGYRDAWVDVDGVWRFDRYLPPADRTPETTYDASDELRSIVLPSRDETADFWAVPNEWVFVRDRPSVGVSGTTDDASEGRYVVTNQSSGSTSVDGRGGLVRRKGPISIDAVDVDSLIARATQIVEADRRVVAHRRYATDPNPGHDHFDVADIVDPILGTGKAAWTAWSLPLNGSPMTHDVEMTG